MSVTAAPGLSRPVLADLGLRARVEGSPAARVLVDALLVATAAGVTGLMAQVVVPLWFTPVPVTGQTLAVVLAGAALGPLRGLLAMTLYLAVGAAGVPWFSGGSSGMSGASAGYIVGFVAAAAVVGALARRGWDRSPLRTALAMAAGNAVIYAVGASWLAVSLGVGAGRALELGVVPFLGGDAVKIALATGLLPGAWWLVRAAHGEHGKHGEHGRR